mmetsp:Transcript_55519/g.107073  ORF Transcript_55519/g.107073 Transcript_55519/m.107073 type:complete len:651 (+) Transcript_55519:109-2061(+)
MTVQSSDGNPGGTAASVGPEGACATTRSKKSAAARRAQRYRAMARLQNWAWHAGCVAAWDDWHSKSPAFPAAASDVSTDEGTTTTTATTGTIFVDAGAGNGHEVCNAELEQNVPGEPVGPGDGAVFPHAGTVVDAVPAAKFEFKLPSAQDSATPRDRTQCTQLTLGRETTTAVHSLAEGNEGKVGSDVAFAKVPEAGQEQEHPLRGLREGLAGQCSLVLPSLPSWPFDPPEIQPVNGNSRPGGETQPVTGNSGPGDALNPSPIGDDGGEMHAGQSQPAPAGRSAAATVQASVGESLATDIRPASSPSASGGAAGKPLRQWKCELCAQTRNTENMENCKTCGRPRGYNPERHRKPLQDIRQGDWQSDCDDADDASKSRSDLAAVPVDTSAMGGGPNTVDTGKNWSDPANRSSTVPLVDAMHRMSREERMGPGGLDPAEVFPTLPEVLQEYFRSGNLDLMNKFAVDIDQDVGRRHLDRCVDCGLWIPSPLGSPRSHVDLSKLRGWLCMPGCEKVALAASQKEVGGQFFKDNRFDLALNAYMKVIELLAHTDRFTAENKAQAAEIKRLSELNKAACYLKLDDPLNAILACDTVLQEDKGNVKALFRRASAHLELGEHRNASIDIEQLLTQNPGNSDAKALSFKVQRAQKAASK